jgi:hypothetical protein
LTKGIGNTLTNMGYLQRATLPSMKFARGLSLLSENLEQIYQSLLAPYLKFYTRLPINFPAKQVEEAKGLPTNLPPKQVQENSPINSPGGNLMLYLCKHPNIIV